MFHRNMQIGDGHYLQQWETADATARAALAPSLLSTDVGKVARQLDTGAFYILSSYSPAVWTLLGSTAVTNNLKKAVNEQNKLLAASRSAASAIFAFRNLT